MDAGHLDIARELAGRTRPNLGGDVTDEISGDGGDRLDFRHLGERAVSSDT